MLVPFKFRFTAVENNDYENHQLGSFCISFDDMQCKIIAIIV